MRSHSSHVSKALFLHHLNHPPTTLVELSRLLFQSPEQGYGCGKSTGSQVLLNRGDLEEKGTLGLGSKNEQEIARKAGVGSGR